MDLVPLVTLATALVVLVLAVFLAVTVTGRRRLERELAASRAELATLQDRLDALARAVEATPGRADRAVGPEYLITSLPDEPGPAPGSHAGPAAPGEAVVPAPASGREFASIARDEALVRLVSLAHGIRRALSAENRNRIRFEMAREVKRARQQRRRDLKEARRHLRAQHADATAGQRDATEDAA